MVVVLQRKLSANMLVAAVFLVLLLLFVGIASSVQANPPNALLQSSWMGVSTGAPYSWLSDADVDRETAALRSAGVGSLRIDIDWSAVEPVQGHRSWANTDRVLAVAQKYSMTVLGVVAYTPPWAAMAGAPSGTTHAPPASAARFADFARAAATRYSSQISTWEVWNEPNLSQFWAPRPDPGAYADLVRQTYAAIKSVQPVSTVLAGALAPATDAPDGSSVRPETFTEALYQAGAAGSFDALSVHPYSYPSLPTDTSTSAWNTFQRLPLVHDVMAHHGDGGKKIWLTELGAPTSLTSNGVSEQRQADIITAGVEAARAMPWIGSVYLYNGRDTGPDRSDPEQNFGLLRTDFTPKPSWYAVQRLTKDMSGTPAG